MASVDTSAYRLAFSDEFNSVSLRLPNTSTGTWDTTLPWGDRMIPDNGEEQFYIDPGYKNLGINPFSAENGILTISAEPASASLKPQIDNQNYTSGMLTSAHTFSETYGYFEMRAQLPAGKGLWPAFWLLPTDQSWPPEIDVVEMLGDQPTNLNVNVHTTAVGTSHGQEVTVPNMTTGFHSYGVLWGPQTLTFYFDGQEVHRTNTPSDMHKPMYMLANLAVGGDWPGSPDASTQFPAEMKIDYIRAYATKDSIPDQTPSGTPTVPPVTEPPTTEPPVTPPPVDTAPSGISDATHPASGAPTKFITATNAYVQVNGTSANDKITGVAGKADTGGLAGGRGDDTYVVDNAGDKIVEKAGQGIDTVMSSAASYKLPANVENLIFSGTKAATGTGNDGNNILAANDAGNKLSGGLGDDLLVGGRGNDVLNGNAGADTMKGGLGKDSYTVDSAGDKVVELSNQGVDTISTGLSYKLGLFVENLILTGAANANGTGSSWHNVITGNNGNNMLSGMDGNDVLKGGKGVDVMLGGAGRDTFVLKAAGDGLDTIKDYKLGVDTLNVQSLLKSIGATSAAQAIQSDMLDLVQSGANTKMIAHIDGRAPITVAVIEHMNALELSKTADHWA